MKKQFVDREKMTGICGKCPHKTTCKVPCQPVKEYLSYQNRAVFEKSFTNEEGQKISIIYSRPKEFNLSSFQREGDGEKNRVNKIEQAFSTENASPFAHFEPDLKQTRLFIDRFFHKFTIEDLAVKYEMTPQKVHEYYAQAKRRVFTILEHLDSNRPLKIERFMEQIRERSGSMTAGQRYFVMSRVFELTHSQIAEIEGTSPGNVSELVRRTADQIRSGEISLFDFTEQEAIEAKARLDRVRERRREHRSNNLEQVREYERNRNRKKEGE